MWCTKLKPLIEHIDELRKRLILIIYSLFFSVVFGILTSPFMINLIISDMELSNVKLVTLSPLELIYTQIKTGFLIGLVIAFPILIYHLIMFFKPAINKKEKIALAYFILPGLGLFMLGAYFGYRVFVRIALFFIGNISNVIGIENMWGINSFISFIVMICIGMGILFEMPLVMVVLAAVGIVDYRTLNSKRAHIYVGLFILAALFTPPDVVTQILVVMPMIVLYELSVLLVKLVKFA